MTLELIDRIDSGNGWLPDRCQAIIRPNPDIISIGHFGDNAPIFYGFLPVSMY